MSSNSDPYILALAGQKGGAGKSTLSIALAAELHRRGVSTVLVDADTQGSCITWAEVCAENESPQAYEPPLVVSLGDNLFRDLPKVGSGRDAVIVDCPGRLGKRQKAALAHADLAVLPITPNATDVWALAESLDLVTEAQQFRPDLDVRILLNKVRTSTTEGAHARELFDLPFPLLNTTLGFRVAYSRFPHEGLDIWRYAKRNRGGSKACAEVSAFASEILAILTGEQHEEEAQARVA